MSVPFAALAGYADNKYAQAIFATLAFVSVWFAAYRVWKGERENVIEIEKKLDPITLRAIEAQEAHTAAIREQSELLREQIEESRKLRDPLKQVIRDQQEQQIKAALNPEFRKQGWFNALRREYIASHDGISPALLAGTELPPAEWMNRRLEELGKPWRMPVDKDK